MRKRDGVSVTGVTRRRVFNRFLAQLPLGLGVGLLLIGLTRAGFLEPLQLIWYDALLSVQNDQPPKYVKLVAVKEDDFAAWGAPPVPDSFPRPMLAALVDRLSRAGVAVICLDLFLDKRSTPAADQRLQAAFRRAAQRGTQIITACDAKRPPPADSPFVGLVTRGCANLRLGPNREVRWLDPVVRSRHGAVPAMSVAAYGTLRERLQEKGLKLSPPPNRPVPIRFWPLGRSFGQYPARHVFRDPVQDPRSGALSDDVLAAWLKDSVVIIGREDAGAQDTHWVPRHQSGSVTDESRFIRMPGMEVQANCLATLLTRRSPRVGTLVVDLGIAGAAAALVSFLLAWLGLKWGSVVSSLVVLIGGTWASLQVFGSTGYVVNLAPIWLAILVQAYVNHRAEQKRLKSWLGAMVSDSVARSLGQTLEPVAGQGQVRAVAVLNYDLRKSTEAAARLAPHEVGPMFNAVLAVVCQVVLEHGGIVNKFLGDGLLAIWLPDAGEQPEAARLALAAARAMPRRIAGMASEWEQRLQRPLRFGIAAHWGQVWVGFVGTPRRLEFTALGNTVNDCYALQDLAAAAGAEILVSEELLQVSEGQPALQAAGDLGTRLTHDHLVYYQVSADGAVGRPGGQDLL